MDKRNLAFLSVIFIAALLFSINQFDYSVDYENNTTLSVYGYKYYSVEGFVYEIKTNDYYAGYNETTLQWLSGLKDRKIFFSQDYYIVMSSEDAIKLPVEDATDVRITDTFTCDIIENRSLGDSFVDILYVKNVEFVNQSIESYQ